MFCWKCGGLLAEGSDYCGSCGAPVAKEEPARAKPMPDNKKKLALILICAAVFAVSVLTTVLVVNMGRKEDAASPVPGVSTSAPELSSTSQAPVASPASAAG